MDNARCFKCGATFNSERALNGHSGFCRSTRSTTTASTKKSLHDLSVCDAICNNEGSDNLTDISLSGLSQLQPCTQFLDLQDKFMHVYDLMRQAAEYDFKALGMLKVQVFKENHNFSEEDVKDLFKLLLHYVKGDLEQVLVLYKRMIREHDKIRADIFSVDSYSYEIPSDFTSGIHLIYEGHYFNILSVIADMMLSFDVNEIHYSSRENENHMVFSNPTTAMQYKKMENYVLTNYGEGYVPLPVIMSFDGLVLNKLSTRNAKPVYIQLGCVKKEWYMSTKNIKCVGFAPQLQVMLSCCPYIHPYYVLSLLLCAYYMLIKCLLCAYYVLIMCL